jgi:hypothetical protein
VRAWGHAGASWFRGGFLVRVCAFLSQTRRGSWPVCGFLALGCMHMQAFARRTRIRAKLPLRLRIRLAADRIAHTRLPHGIRLRRNAVYTGGRVLGVVDIHGISSYGLARLSRSDSVLFVSSVGTTTEPECARAVLLRSSRQSRTACVEFLPQRESW